MYTFNDLVIIYELIIILNNWYNSLWSSPNLDHIMGHGNVDMWHDHMYVQCTLVAT